MFFKEGLDIAKLNRSGLANIDQILGLEIVEILDEEKMIVAKFRVSRESSQPFGLLHGGVSCLLAESIASLAGNLCIDEGYVAVGQSLTANHLKSARVGDEVEVRAINVHRGRASQVWNVYLNCESKLLAQIALTLSIIPKKV